jgi:hypothetical protein
MSNQQGSQFCSRCAAPLLANNQNQQQQHHQGFNNHQMNQRAGASGRAITSMILSIVGLIFCGWLTSIPGMILGKMEMNDIRAGSAPQAGSGFAKVGFYGGIVVTAFYGLIGGLYFVALILS